MRSLLLVCIFQLAFGQTANAATAVAGVREAVAKSYAKIDRFWMLGGAFGTDGGGGFTMVDIEFRFDRRTKQLAIGELGAATPFLLVKGNQAFLFLWRDKEEVSTYLQIENDRAITWKDIDGGWQVVQKECGPCAGLLHGGIMNPIVCSAASRLVAPFLEDGLERMVSAESKMNLAPTDRAAAEKLVEAGKLAAMEFMIVELGHPDYRMIALPTKLDPKKFPICVTTEDKSSGWYYAFDRRTWMISGAIGVVDHKEMCGFPGNKVAISMKQGDFTVDGTVVKPFPEFKPVTFELPKGAEIIGVADLRDAYIEVVKSKIGAADLQKQIVDVKKELQRVVREESELQAKIAKLSAGSSANREGLEGARLKLADAQGAQQTYAYIIAELQRVIDDIAKRESDKAHNDAIPQPRHGRGLRGRRARCFTTFSAQHLFHFPPRTRL